MAKYNVKVKLKEKIMNLRRQRYTCSPIFLLTYMDAVESLKFRN